MFAGKKAAHYLFTCDVNDVEIELAIAVPGRWEVPDPLIFYLCTKGMAILGYWRRMSQRNREVVFYESYIGNRFSGKKERMENVSRMEYVTSQTNRRRLFSI